MGDVADLLRSARQALSKGDHAQALPMLEEAIGVAPESSDARSLLGVCLWMAGRHADGLHESQRAVDLDPQSARSHYNLGVILESAGRLDEAAQHFRMALDVSPEYERAAEALRTLAAPAGARGSATAESPERPGFPPSQDTAQHTGKAAPPDSAPVPRKPVVEASRTAEAPEDSATVADAPEDSHASAPAEEPAAAEESPAAEPPAEAERPTSEWHTRLVEALKDSDPGGTQ